MNIFVNQDCFDFLPSVNAESVDLVICDLPYGTTQCKWDSRISFDKLWPMLWRLSKPNTPVLMFASQPFTSLLVTSQLENFRYEWIWEKSKASNFLDAKKRPLKSHESILVFCKQRIPYFPQMTKGKAYKARPGKKITDVYGTVKDTQFRNNNQGTRYPRSVIYFKTAESEGKTIHSTQKPVALLEYIISTYTKPNDVVLDPCAGSCSVGIAARNINRSYICCEKDEKLFRLADNRLADNSRRDIDDDF